MKEEVYQLKDLHNDANRELYNAAESIKDAADYLRNCMRAFEATGDLITADVRQQEELEGKQAEIDDLKQQLERMRAESISQREQMQAEIDSLRKELLDVREQNLEAESNQKPMEIHNHFEQGCSAQVFNDRVKGRFPTKTLRQAQGKAKTKTITKTKTKTKLKNKKDKEKGKWKNLVRKML